MTDNLEWHTDVNMMSHQEFGAELNEYTELARRRVALGHIRESFLKEILFELSRLDDMSYRLDDHVRAAVDYCIHGNLNGASIDLSITPPTEDDHEEWENNLRKLFSAVFTFVENPSDLTYLAMDGADLQRSGEYDD